MSYLLLLVYLALFIFIIHKGEFFQSKLFSKQIVSAIFLTKFTAGISLYLIYAYFYDTRSSADIFKYFDDGNIIHSAIHQNVFDYLKMLTGIKSDSPHLMKYYDTCSFWIKNFNYGLFNDNRTVIRFNAIVRLFSMGNIHIHTLFMSFISFTGMWAIFKVFEKENRFNKWILVLVIFYFPSVIFWTSGLLKEGILMFAFGMLLYFFIKILNKQRIALSLFWILASVFLLLISKFYVLIAALPALIFLISSSFIKKGRAWQFLSVHLLIFILIWFSNGLIGLNFPEILANKQNDFINYTNSLKNVGSKIEINKLEPTIESIISNAPQALVNSFFRPTVFESKNLMMLMAAFENLIIVLLIALALVFFTRKNTNNQLFWFCVSFTLILFTLSGLTTPILGALVRYKAPALPFLGLALLYLINFEKINTITDKITKRIK